MFTIVESYNEDEFINHHGFKRNVPDTPERLFTTKTQQEDDNDPEEKSNKKKQNSKIKMIAKTFGNYI